ncbi:hypothetical protein PV10_08074 [Exophiala mesophila]|uniref:Uncharacterized protein n=1 Tax=Exophiala mesophila TaxID=212818 RepID=A0A0D1Z0P4_EXOME|nr:uncharacterized protein PV10_08074 [Exophiala mesophila]KIV88387.1 hypothetical protein PV10_08074 [Exophiala mesophila]
MKHRDDRPGPTIAVGPGCDTPHASRTPLEQRTSSAASERTEVLFCCTCQQLEIGEDADCYPKVRQARHTLSHCRDQRLHDLVWWERTKSEYRASLRENDSDCNHNGM